MYDLEVRGVYTGTVGPTTTVSTETQCCVCGVTYTPGEDTYVFAAVGDDGQLVADSCSPAGDWGGKPSDEWMAALRDAYGEPRPPVAT